MAIETPRTRRQVLSAAVAAAGGALAARAVGVTDVVEAADGDTVKVGQSFSGTATTTITNTAASSSAVALKGVVSTTGAGGSTAGVWGQSAGQNGNGVFGYSTNTGSDAKGVWGRSTNGKGVYGDATGASGESFGVYGTSASSGGKGVYGSGGIGVQGQGGTYGVYGRGYRYGVFGSGQTAGAYGIGPTGVHGHGTQYGLYAEGGTYGLYAKGTTYAGYFHHKVHVAGTLSATTKHFLIDHPQDPANRTLSHSCVEAPEMLNVYSGTVTLGADGTATVRLPRYFVALNADHRYQLTPIGPTTSVLYVAREVSRGGTFRIGGGTAGQRVCWQVTGVRQDASARHRRLRVERTKGHPDRGRYLDPEAFGKPQSAAMHPAPKVQRPRRRRRTIPAGRVDAPMTTT